MNKFIHSLKPGVAVTITAFMLAFTGVGVTLSAHAVEGERTIDDRGRTIENGTNPDDRREQLRTKQREAEAKKQEMRAAKEAAEAELKAQREAMRTARQEKLSASKLEICKNREANINNRLARIADRSTKHLVLFNSISERAQKFYVDQGNTLADYDELVADVNAKKAAAETAIATINTTKASFDCEGENPKLAVEEFKNSLRAAIDVLKEYRTSVKNLIVGIKSVNATQVEDSSKSTDGAE